MQDQGCLFKQEAMSFCAGGTEEWNIVQNSRFDPASGFIYDCSLLPSLEQMQFLLCLFPVRNGNVHPFPTQSNQQLCLLCLLLDSAVVLSYPMTIYPFLL